MKLTNKFGLPQTMFYTYIHRKASDGSVFYVGKGVKKRAWDCKRRNPKWKNIVAKHGHTVEVCASWDNAEDAFTHEKFLILCFTDMGFNLANLTAGGDGPNGYKYTEEQKVKMSLRRIGYKHTEETKQKIAIAQIGVSRSKASDETKAKMSVLHKGRIRMPMPDATKKKISENNGSKHQNTRDKISKTLTGRTSSEEHKMKISISLKGKPKSIEHKEKIRIARLKYFAEQRNLHGKTKTISEAHRSALRAGYNKYFGVKNEINE